MYDNLPDDHLFTPSEAVKYLREKRGIIYQVSSLRNFRRSGKTVPKLKLINNALWTKAELDTIEPTSRTKRVGQRAEDDENDPRALSVTPHVGQALSSASAA
jgi:hypothetical protein